MIDTHDAARCWQLALGAERNLDWPVCHGVHLGTGAKGQRTLAYGSRESWSSTDQKETSQEFLLLYLHERKKNRYDQLWLSAGLVFLETGYRL
jgi:hypothetical protein